MKCEWLVTSDYGLVDQKGKPGMIGIFDTIAVENLPVLHPRLAVSFKVTGAQANPGLSISLLGPKGNTLYQHSAPDFQVGPDGVAYGVFLLDNLRFAEEGAHVFSVRDGETELSRTIVKISAKA